jgi:hypothetical protein
VPFVLTVDERFSRRAGDRVESVLEELAAVETVLPFERTGDDEFQGVVDDPAVVVDLALDLVRAGGWTIGIGAGAVRTPLPRSTRGANGPAFLLSRRAVDAAKQRGPARLAVRGAAPSEAGDAQAVLTSLAVLVDRRSAQAWEAIALVQGGRTQAQAASALGISRQAVGQRLAAALWDLERELRPAAERLLSRAAAG